MVAAVFLYSRKLRSLLYKNAPRGSHCGGKETAAFLHGARLAERSALEKSHPTRYT